MKATVVWNEKYSKWDGIHCGKVVSRCANPDKVVEYFLKRGFISANVTVINSKTSAPKKVKTVVANGKSVRDRLIAETMDVVKSAKSVFNVDLNPAVRFFNRGTVAGKAHYKDMSVSYNEVLAEENPKTFNNTVIHEVAHLVVRKLYPYASAHGKEFKFVMRSLGGNGERCHSYDVSSVKVKRSYTYHVVKCDCGEHKVSKARAMRASNLRCKKCGSRCTYNGKTVTEKV